jgi:hypothetical protein
MGTICHVQLFVVSGCVMRRGAQEIAENAEADKSAA